MSTPSKYRKVVKVNAKWTDEETAQLCDILNTLPDVLNTTDIEDLQQHFPSHSIQSLRCKIKSLKGFASGIFFNKLIKFLL